MYSMPAFLQASISAGVMGREALLMWLRGRIVGLAAAELLEAAAGAGDADGGRAHVRVGLAELLGHRFRDREDRARAVDRDEGRRGLAAFLSGLVGAAAARVDSQRQRRERSRPNDGVSHVFTLSNGNYMVVSGVLIPRYGLA